MKQINLYPGFVQDQLVKRAEGSDFDHERNKGRAATWCARAQMYNSQRFYQTGVRAPCPAQGLRHADAQTVILIVFNALKIGNVDFVVTRPTLAQYEAIYAVS